MPINEVSARSTAPATPTMSPEGAARLAALSPAERTIAPDGQGHSQHRVEQLTEEERAARAAKVKDADGGEANLEDGSYKAPERPQPTQPGADAPVDAIPELLVSSALKAEADAYRQDVANIASDYPALADEASVLFQFIGTAAARDYDTDVHDGVMVNGQTPGAQLWNEARCRAQLSNRYGQSQAERMIKAASNEWQKLPDKVKAYLDTDMGAGARLGSHPAVVAGLALRKYAQMSPERARAELVQRRSGEKYGQGGRLEKDILHMLNIIAARGPQAQGQTFSTSGRDVPAGQGSAASKALRAELAALNDPKSDLHSSDSAKRKRAVARRQQIQAELAKGAS